jgi:hypothetical protein
LKYGQVEAAEPDTPVVTAVRLVSAEPEVTTQSKQLLQNLDANIQFVLAGRGHVISHTLVAQAWGVVHM